MRRPLRTRWPPAHSPAPSLTGAAARAPLTWSTDPRKLDVLKRHWVAEGRDQGALEKTSLDPASVGIETAIGSVKGVEQIEAVETIGRDVIPAVRDLRQAHRRRDL